MRKPLFVIVLTALAVSAPLACDLEKTGNQLQAQKVMVATILATPPVTVSPEALVGAGLGLDGGFDAGLSPGDGGVTVPPQTVTYVFFGERDRTSFDEPPSPINGATVTVRSEGGSPFTLEARGEGNYELTSASNEALHYESGATYLFTAQHGGETFVGRVEQAPQLEEIAALHPPKGFIEHPAHTAFSFTRPPAPAGRERNLGFVTVFPVDESGGRGEPTWTNIPDDPLDMLLLVANPAKWKADTVVVPGSAFPERDRTYVLLLQAVKLGGPESDNLFTGSAILAGTAEVGVFRTK